MNKIIKVCCVCVCFVGMVSYSFAQQSSTRKSKAVEGSVLGGVLGAVTGAAIGSKKSGDRALKGAAVGGVAGALLGGVVGAQVPNEKATDSIESNVVGQTSIQSNVSNPLVQEGVYQINVPKRNSSEFVMIEIKRFETGFIGPQGEKYTNFPTITELQQRYGE